MPIDEDNINKYLKEVDNKIFSNLKKAALMVERDAKLLVAVDTGTLKRSITHEFIGKRTVIVGSNIEYAESQEIGTAKMAAHPYLRPALKKNEKAIRKLLK